MINLTITTDSKEAIGQSFDRIAKDLIHNWQLRVNEDLYSFTEIEFYFFHEGVHEDISTHEHDYKEGQWRLHSQGLDITFQSTDKQDGGILIRGLKKDGEYINGPKRATTAIFKSLGDVTSTHKEFGLTKKPEATNEEIKRTSRHGLSDKQKNGYKNEPYRYFIDLENWSPKHLSSTDKQKILDNCQ